MLSYIFNWTLLWWIMLIIYLPACIGLIIVVLLQKGKGGGFAGAFGAGGGSEAVFGPRTSRSLPQKLTYTMAGTFLFLALVMSVLAGKVGKGAAPALVADQSEMGGAPSEQMNQLFEDEAPAGAPGSDITPVEVVEGETPAPLPVEPPLETAPELLAAPEPEEESPAAAPLVIEEGAPAPESETDAAVDGQPVAVQ